MIPDAHAWAAQEARDLGDDHIGPGHFLLGLARRESVAAEALRACGVEYPPDRTTAYVVAGADFDLQGLVDEVLAR